LGGEGGSAKAELETGEHGEEDPEGEVTVASTGDGQDEKAEAADGDKRFVTRKWNQKQAACGEEEQSGGEKDFV